jgi:hypothetical protein
MGCGSPTSRNFGLQLLAQGLDLPHNLLNMAASLIGKVHTLYVSSTVYLNNTSVQPTQAVCSTSINFKDCLD